MNGQAFNPYCMLNPLPEFKETMQVMTARSLPGRLLHSLLEKTMTLQGGVFKVLGFRNFFLCPRTNDLTQDVWMGGAILGSHVCGRLVPRQV